MVGVRITDTVEPLREGEELMTALPLTTGRWRLDKNHSGAFFKVRHLGLTNVRGRFNGVDATLLVGDSLDDTRLEAEVDLATVDTNQPDRDAHLRSTDFFSTGSHPTMSLVSRSISRTGTDAYEVEADLEINGTTNTVTLAVQFTGIEVFPSDGKRHAGFIASGRIDRDDFGIDFNLPIGVDKLAIGKRVDIDLEAQFVEPG